MKLKKALRIARRLYIVCFGLAAFGLLAELSAPHLARLLFAGCLAVLAVFAAVMALYVHCPKCGHVIRINPLKETEACPWCGEVFGDED